MLQLPSAWSRFISESTHGASCLGQLSGLESKKLIYKQAVETLADGRLTTVILVTRPETAPLKEAERASGELSALGVNNQMLVINGILIEQTDILSSRLYEKQQATISAIPERLKAFQIYLVPLRSYNVTGLKNMRALLTTDYVYTDPQTLNTDCIPSLGDVIDELAAQILNAQPGQ